MNKKTTDNSNNKTNTKNKKNAFQIILYISVFTYLIFTFVKTEKVLLAYKQEEKNYQQEKEEQLEKQKNLKETKDNIDCKEYIEKLAREKLDMYFPNERLYIDKCN